MMDVKERLRLGKLTVLRKVPLLAPLIAKIKFVESPQDPTMAVSYRKKVIYYNPEFVKRISNEGLVAVLLHEYLHYVFIHDLVSLRNIEDRFLINLVTDAIINYLVKRLLESDAWLKETGGVTFDHLRELCNEFRNYSDDALAKEDHVYLARKIKERIQNFLKDLKKLLCEFGFEETNSDSSKEVLNSKEFNKRLEEIIEKHFKNSSKEFKEGLKKAIREVLQAQRELEGITESEKKKLVNEIRRELERGKIIMKGRGTEYGGIEDIIDLILRRKRRDWRKILREVTSEIKNIISDYDYTKPSVKTKIFEEVTGKKTFIPALEKEDIDVNVVIGIDVSGSISDEEYGEFVSEVYNLLSEVKEVKGWVVMWEAKVTRVIEIRNGWNKKVLDELKKRKGYGGTIIESFFKKAEELVKNKKRRTYVIVLTDGYTEKVSKEWVKGWKKVIFIISKNGTKESLRDVENEKNVLISFLN